MHLLSAGLNLLQRLLGGSPHKACPGLRGCAAADPLDPDFLQRIVDPHVNGPTSSGEGVYTIMLNPCLQPSEEPTPTSALQLHGSVRADPQPAGVLPHSPVFAEPQMEGFRTVSAAGLAEVLPPAGDLPGRPTPHASPTGTGGGTRQMQQHCHVSACRPRTVGPDP